MKYKLATMTECALALHLLSSFILPVWHKPLTFGYKTILQHVSPYTSSYTQHRGPVTLQGVSIRCLHTEGAAFLSSLRDAYPGNSSDMLHLHVNFHISLAAMFSWFVPAI